MTTFCVAATTHHLPQTLHATCRPSNLNFGTVTTLCASSIPKGSSMAYFLFVLAEGSVECPKTVPGLDGGSDGDAAPAVLGSLLWRGPFFFSMDRAGASQMGGASGGWNSFCVKCLADMVYLQYSSRRERSQKKTLERLLQIARVGCVTPAEKGE